MRKRGFIFVISGPSGSGKTTLIKNLLKDKGLTNTLAKSVSFTTRPKRANEKNRRDYFFITPQRFKALLRGKKIIEWTRYLGYYYGTPKDFIAQKVAEGKDIILCLDVRGARQLKRLYPQNTRLIFVVPPSVATLQERIIGRCHKTQKQEIQKRLQLAQKEILHGHRYDYQVINKNLTQALRFLKGIILKELQSKKEAR